MNETKSLFLAGCCCVMLACQERPVTYRLDLIAEVPIQLPAGQVVGRATDIDIDDRGRFYLSDRSEHTVWVLEPNGKLAMKIGSNGQGPGELVNPVSVKIAGDSLLVLEAGNGRISFFNRMTGAYLSSMQVMSASFLNGMEKHGDRVVVSEVLGIQNYEIYSLSDGKLVAHGHTPPTAVVMPIYLSGGQVSLTPDHAILFSRPTRYAVQKLDWSGKLVMTYENDTGGYQEPDLSSDQDYTKHPDQAISGVAFQMANGLVLKQWFRRRVPADGEQQVSWDRYFDVFAADGNLLQAKLPAPELFIHTQDDRLYAVDTAPLERGATNPTIVVYGLVTSSHWD